MNISKCLLFQTLTGLALAGTLTAAEFYRLTAPTTTVITAFTLNGELSWSNNPVQFTATVERAESLTPPTQWRPVIQSSVTAALSRLRIFDPGSPSGMSYIPAGIFKMGDPFVDGFDPPPTTIYVSPFYIDKYEVTADLWETVRNWALTNGYTDLPIVAANSNHPMPWVNWYDCVKWCNARSEREGLAPCYMRVVLLKKTPYRTGEYIPSWNPSTLGYRLPTEAEWEKAARGGAGTCRFSWSNTNTIDHTRATYSGGGGYAYDTGFPGQEPNFATTAPVGAFAPNGYGLYDMTGNVAEWCWDYYDGGNYQPNARDPLGPASGPLRVIRGGSWGLDAFFCRVANRTFSDTIREPTCQDGNVGFRTVRKAPE